MIKLNIFEIMSDDNKLGFFIEDWKFLNIMDKEFYMNLEGKWIVFLLFCLLCELILDNY